MRMVDLIQKKKMGSELTALEIDFAVQGYTKGDIPDYQMSALLMAIYFKGMSKEEIANLTTSFVDSGDKIDLSRIDGIKVDKHSTGGVGDKISLIVIPLVASVGIAVAKMSGKGLGHTGGTIDKLESIPGFRTELTEDEFFNNVNQYKMAIVGQTTNLTPADKKIYGLRDVTATVDSIPLIASSIMSKKIASGADCILLDVKTGSGAFMKTLEESIDLARTMVEIGKSLNRNTVAIISDMSQPLGFEIGNANEVKEAVDVLKGQGPEDVTEIALVISSHMAVLGKAFTDYDAAYDALKKRISSGEALVKFKQLVTIQGGDSAVIDDTSLLPIAKYHVEVKADREGYVSSINAESIGICAMLLGAGRAKKSDPIDYAAGITLVKKLGNKVNKGDVLCILHTNITQIDEPIAHALEAFNMSPEAPKQQGYIYDIIK